ncbi:unnamed protein product (macronuclear) [Paramecium tetraurelia]|uniref:Beta-lactamase class A catalytic domain-containing protein n=1 Tax=Paramecium tetraurelia TaxID=5888 RepID=A0CWH4_PARTE|nr:uncharacterized protein GSPATT00001344001 [Paramecium tetraurelia]CAK75141.1 unnamed protein product [Paramecium tetraurelia]|eukprot:XP_001442538.1 hypothetical protein (macronuclear) [Paramecium tetraurelia strain d4-2]
MINLVEGVFVASDESNLAYFDLLKSAYNEGNAALIYNLFSRDTQKATSLEIFSSQIEAIRNRQGIISYWVYSTVDKEKPSVLLGFQKHLGTGTLFWSYDQKGKIASFSMNDHMQPSMIQWIKHYPNKFSFSVIADNKVIADYFGYREQTLMSVFKIIVAIEYCKQLNEGKINEEDWINLNEVNKFYIKELDLSHANFLQIWEQQGKLKEGQLQLKEIAIGMIALSSNACTEYLQTLLTLQSIENTVDQLGLKQSQIFYLSSFLSVFTKDEQSKKEEFIQNIQKLSQNEVYLKSMEIHDQLNQNNDLAKDYLSRGKQLLDGEVLKIQSKYFTKSTTSEYSKMLDKLNNGFWFNEQFYSHFYALMGYVSMQNPALAKEYDHIGVKGGSSAIQGDDFCVLTIGLFQQLKKAVPFKRTAVAFFIESLDYETEFKLILEQYNEFIALISLNGLYLDAVSKEMAQDQILL